MINTKTVLILLSIVGAAHALCNVEEEEASILGDPFSQYEQAFWMTHDIFDGSTSSLWRTGATADKHWAELDINGGYRVTTVKLQTRLSTLSLGIEVLVCAGPGGEGCTSCGVTDNDNRDQKSIKLSESYSSSLAWWTIHCQVEKVSDVIRMEKSDLFNLDQAEVFGYPCHAEQDDSGYGPADRVVDDGDTFMCNIEEKELTSADGHMQYLPWQQAPFDPMSMTWDDEFYVTVPLSGPHDVTKVMVKNSDLSGWGDSAVQVTVCDGPGGESCYSCGVNRNSEASAWWTIECPSGHVSDTVRLVTRFFVSAVVEIRLFGSPCEPSQNSPECNGEGEEEYSIQYGRAWGENRFLADQYQSFYLDVSALIDGDPDTVFYDGDPATLWDDIFDFRWVELVLTPFENLEITQVLVLDSKTDSSSADMEVKVCKNDLETYKPICSLRGDYDGAISGWWSIECRPGEMGSYLRLDLKYLKNVAEVRVCVRK